MLVILSPAKTMDMSLDGDIPSGTQCEFNANAEFLAQKMKRYSVDELARLLKISPQLAQNTYQRYAQFDQLDTPRKPALFAYNGSVFKAIAVGDLTDDDLQYAQDSVRIVSTLYGSLRPLDLIKAYRIAFTLKLDGMPGDLYDYWYDKLTEPLIRDGQKAGGVLVNLASLDVAASLDMSRLKDALTIITPEFREFKNGKYEVIRTYAKIARGAMTRFIIEQRAQTPQSLTAFEWQGYKFNEELSSEHSYLYTR